MENITEVFYKEIIPQALNGCVDCEIPVRIIFNVFFKETGTFLKATDKYEGVIIPTLIINNKNELDNLLKEYVEVMLAFYNNFEFTKIDPVYYEVNPK